MRPVNGSKTCSTCRIDFPATEEFFHKVFRDGRDFHHGDKLANDCKRCARSAARKRNRQRLSGDGTRRQWTDMDLSFLRDNWLCMSDAELARELGRSRRSIMKKRELLRLLRAEPKNPLGVNSHNDEDGW